MIVKGRITANDIKYGVKGDQMHCPLHRSLARRKPFKDRSFRVTAFLIKDGSFLVTKRFPLELRQWILKFDKYGSVEPINYEIEVDDSWLG